MIPLEVRFEDVSGKASIIVTANLADNWRPLTNQCGFYGFAHEKYLEDGLITVRVWVIETPSQSIRAQDSFPLDLQSMGSSPSRALAFRLFNGRLSVGAALNTVINSRRGDGSPGYYKEAVLLAQHAGVSYWLRFYAALNDGHPDMPEWTEEDIPSAEVGTPPRVTDIRELRASSIEDRLSRVSVALDSLEERTSTLVRDVRARHDDGPEASQGKGLNRAADLENTAQELKEQWFKEFEKQAEAALEKLREEGNKSSRAIAESQQQLAVLAETKLASLHQITANAAAGLEATAAKLRVNVSDSRRALAESQQQLASLAETKLASLHQVAANATAGLEATAAKLREDVSDSRRALAEHKQQLGSLTEARLASPVRPESSDVAGLEAAMAKLREEVCDSGRALAESKRQLASLADAKLASPNQAATNATAGLEVVVTKLREEVSNLGRVSAENQQQLASLTEARPTSLNQPAASTIAGLEAAMATLREEVSSSGQALAEGKQQLASLTEAKLASLNRSAANAMAGFEAAAAKLREEVSNSREALAEGKQQLASLTEAKLASLNLATANAIESLETAAAKLREEVNDSARVLAESRDRLASLAEAKIALLGEVASAALSKVEAEQGRFRSQYEASRRESWDGFPRRLANQHSAFDDNGNASKRRGVVAMLSLAAGLFLVVAVTPWSEILSTPPPVPMHLQTQVPSDFADLSPSWSAKRRAKEEETAQGYWQAAASSLQIRYPYGSELPADPSPEFRVDTQDAPAGGAAAVKETRARYWEKLRAYWGQRRFWVESQPEEETWAVHVRRVWEQFKAKLG